ncbi:unnamed protein product [Ixodes hexagonus]
MNPWKPGSKYCFPTLGKRKLKFQTQWTEKYPWLVYSRCQGQEGALCNVCVLFGQECSGKGSHQKLGGLVLTPFVRWKNALETFKAHSESEYHKTAARRRQLRTSRARRVSQGKDGFRCTRAEADQPEEATREFSSRIILRNARHSSRRTSSRRTAHSGGPFRK